MKQTYCGDFEVEDNGFPLAADRFIVDDDVINFEFSGSVDLEKFTMEGSAKRQPDGVFLAKDCAVKYALGPGGTVATVTFTDVSPSKSKCVVKGEWHEEDETWEISAELEPFVPAQDRKRL